MFWYHYNVWPGDLAHLMVVVISSEGQEKMVSTGGDPRSATANSGWCGWTASAVTPPPVLRNLRGENVVSSAVNRSIGEVVQSRRRPLLGPSPG